MKVGEAKIGDRKNKLVVIDVVRRGVREYIHVKCDCGKEKFIRADHFGSQQSCGCACVECGKSMVQNLDKFRTKHGLCHTRIYDIWMGIKRRCNNENEPAYYRYGGRGIRMCDEWERSVEKFTKWAFANGYKSHLTIDRVDNNKGYSPDNCRWVTMKEQGNNRSSNVRITIDGKTKNAAQWAEEYGVKRRVVYDRLANGWSIEDTFNTPVGSKRKSFMEKV